MDVQASADQPFTGVVASFTDSGPTPVAGYAATIFWGDGTTSDGAVVAESNGFGVTGAHTYPVPGHLPAPRGDPRPRRSHGERGGHGDRHRPGPPDQRRRRPGHRGRAFSGPVAALAVPGWDHGPADLTVSIDWGDGHTSAGTLVGTAAGTFTVFGANTYAEEGRYAVTVKVADRSAAGFTIATTATVADAGLAADPVPVEAAAGVPFAGPVATFRDANPGAVAADFTATITWGDGGASAGTVAADATTADQFVVTGSHLYSSAGTFPVGVVIADVGGSTATAAGSAAVRSAAGASFAATADVPFATVVATVTGAGPDAAGDFTATIDWGDGTTSAGLLTPDPAGGDRFLVLGASTYLAAGQYPVNVAITSPTGFQANVGGTATVGPAPDAPPTALPALPIAAQSGSPVRSVVAAFRDADPSGGPADFSGVIAWGDGSTSAGSVVAAPGAPGLFFVVGSHTYAARETVPVQVTVRDVGGSFVESATLALVAEAAPGGPALTPAAAVPAAGEVAGRPAPIVPGEAAAPAFVLVSTAPVEAAPAEAPPLSAAPRALVAGEADPGAGTLGASQQDADDFWPWSNDRPASDATRDPPPAGAPPFRVGGEDGDGLPPASPEADDPVPSAVRVDEVFIRTLAQLSDRDRGVRAPALTGPEPGGTSHPWAGAALVASALGLAARWNRRDPAVGCGSIAGPPTRKKDRPD